jgi:hypothetical protein
MGMNLGRIDMGVFFLEYEFGRIAALLLGGHYFSAREGILWGTSRPDLSLSSNLDSS